MPSCGKNAHVNFLQSQFESDNPLWSTAPLPFQTNGELVIQKAWCYHLAPASPPPHSPLCGASLMSSACKLIPAPDDSVARIAIVLHSSRKTIKNARVWGCLLNTSVTMHWINPKDHHMKVIKLPSSIMNGTISRDSGLLLWEGWMGGKIAGEEVLCSATLVSCCRDDDYDDSGDDDGDVNVCKCSLLEGVIVTHVCIFAGMWDERNWHLLLMTNPRSLFFLTEFESFCFCSLWYWSIERLWCITCKCYAQPVYRHVAVVCCSRTIIATDQHVFMMSKLQNIGGKTETYAHWRSYPFLTHGWRCKRIWNKTFTEICKKKKKRRTFVMN